MTGSSTKGKIREEKRGPALKGEGAESSPLSSSDRKTQKVRGRTAGAHRTRELGKREEGRVFEQNDSFPAAKADFSATPDKKNQTYQGDANERGANLRRRS